VFCLSLHADYLCRRTGTCCTSGWPIHVECDRLADWRQALGSGRLRFAADEAVDGLPFVASSDLPPGAGAVLRMRASGACVLYDEHDGLCAVHRDLGHSSLPSACQHFPRRCLIEPDRIAVSLSHCCPTVAQLAFRTDVAPAAVPAPTTMVGRLSLEGLDARDALPPLLRPGVLADHQTYHAWEERVVGVLGLDITPEQALARISAFTEELRRWTPADGSLSARFESLAAAEAEATGVGAVPDARAHAEAFSVVRASVPAGVEGGSDGSADRCAILDNFDRFDAAFVAPAWPAFSRPLRQFLAAHAFGNWCAYNGRGLRTVVRSLDVALKIVRVEAGLTCAKAGRHSTPPGATLGPPQGRLLDEALLAEAFGAADLLLVHLADPTALAERLGVVEDQNGIT
jgi:hypothetical protein